MSIPNILKGKLVTSDALWEIVTTLLSNINIPNISSWALQPNKPTYSYTEISGLSNAFMDKSNYTFPVLKVGTNHNTTIGSGTIMAGTNCEASGNYSLSSGYYTSATGEYSQAMGNRTEAQGFYSHAEGSQTVTSGIAAHSEGNFTHATGNYSHAEGRYTYSTANSSHSEGIDTNANGDASHAEGTNTAAKGSSSYAGGLYTIASGLATHVFGAYNEDLNSTVTNQQVSKGTYIEIVGNGTGSNKKSNARTLDWNGNEWLAGGLTAAGGTLTVGSTALTEVQIQELKSIQAWAKAAQKPTYTAAEVGATTTSDVNSLIASAIGNIHSFNLSVVQTLPVSNIDTHTIYLLPKTGETNDVYDEYLYVNNNWEMIGNTQIDLSNYAQIADIPTKVSDLTNDSEFLSAPFIYRRYVPQNLGSNNIAMDFSLYAQTNGGFIPTAPGYSILRTSGINVSSFVGMNTNYTITITSGDIFNENKDANRQFPLKVNGNTTISTSNSIIPSGNYLLYYDGNGNFSIDTTGKIPGQLEPSSIQVSGTTPAIIAEENTSYVCGEVSTLSFTPAITGINDVVFESGATATVLTVPNTVKFPEWFDATALEPNMVYEISIRDGTYGAVMAWATT